MNQESKQHTFGIVIILALMLVISVPTGYIVSENTIKADDNEVFTTSGFETQAVYTDFNYSKQITIDSGQVPGDLTNFPVCINITDADLITHVTNGSGYDIAFFDSTNVTQYNHEIELFDSTIGNLTAWVNVTSLTGASDTIFYMYYGFDDTNQQNRNGTWDQNYTVVWHFNEPGLQNDSTVNDNDLVNMTNTPSTMISGEDLIGYAVDFDAASVGSYNASSPILIVPPYTVEAAIKPDSASYRGCILSNTINQGFQMEARAEGMWGANMRTTDVAANLNSADHNDYDIVDAGVSQMFSLQWAGPDASAYFYKNGGNKTEEVAINMDASETSKNFVVGENGHSALFWDGYVDEIRVSNIVRSDDWILTTGNTYTNATNGSFFLMGDEVVIQGDGSVYSLKGLTSSRITWQGTAGTTVYCNSSGDDYEWMEINMTINASDNVTEIRVWVDDLNNTGPTEYVNASNISLLVTNAANITYYNFGTFADGGSNVTINKTTWNTYANPITNPFNETGLTDTSTSIFCVFRLTIPSGSSTDIFWSAASDTYKVYIGHI